jgi:PAS domain S-box-containing protein
MATNNSDKTEKLIKDIINHGVLDAFGDGISIQDTSYRILFQNKTHKEFIGDHHGEFCYEAYGDNKKTCEGCPLKEAFGDGKVHTAIRSASTKEGLKFFDITASPVKDKRGTILAGIEIVRDITERKNIEKALIKSENEYRNIVDNSLVGVYKTNLKGDILYVNSALTRMFEFKSPEEMMSVGVTSLYSNPRDRELLIDNLKRTGKVNAFEIDVDTRTGKTKNIILSAVLDNNNISGMIMDITKRKQSEKLLKKERDMAQKYLDVAGVMIVVLGKEGKVQLINRTGCEILGYKEEEIIGKNWFDTFLPSHIKNEVSDVFKQLMSGKIDLVKYYENPIITNRGEERVIAWYNTLLYDESGSITGSLSSGEDITLRKKIEQELKDRIKELESFYDLAIERELKMKKLKEEIERLKGELKVKER